MYADSMRFEQVIQIGRDEAEDAFASGDAWRICDALVRIAYHDPDWRWVEMKCLEFTSHPDMSIRMVAVICFSHIARIHGVLHVEKVLPVLRELERDPELSGTVEDTLEDLRIFLRIPIKA